MPHLVILYTPNVEAGADMPGLCRELADTMCATKDDAGQPVFPTGGVRVYAYPAAHYAVADGSGDHGFIYLNLRMARGRPEAVRQRAGEQLAAVVKDRLAPLLAQQKVGVTLQVDEGAEVFDAKLGNLHPVFAKAT